MIDQLSRIRVILVLLSAFLVTSMLEAAPQETKKNETKKKNGKKGDKQQAQKEKSEKEKAEKEKAEKEKPKRLDVKIGLGKKAEAAYDKFFAKYKAESKSVRARVRLLKRQKRFNEIVAMTRAAIRNGQSQPWMYEAMGLALQMQNAPPEELERALMSLLDFTVNPNQRMILADYMGRSGLQKRALQVAKQVALEYPDRPEPFHISLTVPADNNDHIADQGFFHLLKELLGFLLTSFCP